MPLPGSEVGEEIEGASHEHRLTQLVGSHDGCSGILDYLDASEARCCKRSELGSWERSRELDAGSTSGRGSEWS